MRGPTHHKRRDDHTDHDTLWLDLCSDRLAPSGQSSLGTRVDSQHGRGDTPAHRADIEDERSGSAALGRTGDQDREDKASEMHGSEQVLHGLATVQRCLRVCRAC
jgi:hypothetical protein